MLVERVAIDERTKEELAALNRLCAYVAGEAKALNVPEAETLGTAVSQRIQELLSQSVRH